MREEEPGRVMERRTGTGASRGLVIVVPKMAKVCFALSLILQIMRFGQSAAVATTGNSYALKFQYDTMYRTVNHET